MDCTHEFCCYRPPGFSSQRKWSGSNPIFFILYLRLKYFFWFIRDSGCFCGLSGCCSCAPTCKCPQWQLSIVSGVRTFLGSVAGLSGQQGYLGLVKWVPGLPMHCKVMPYGLLLSMILRDISWVVWYKWAGSCLRFPDSFFFSIILIRCDRDSAVFAYWIDCLLDEDRSQFQNTLCKQRQTSLWTASLFKSPYFGSSWPSRCYKFIRERGPRAYLSNFGILPIDKLTNFKLPNWQTLNCQIGTF